MNRPASKEPSMDEILSSIRQIIADDEPQQDDKAPAAQEDEAAARSELSAALNDVSKSEGPTTIEVEDGPHPDIEAAPIEKRDVAAEALAEAQSAQIEPDADADADAPLTLSIDQMLQPSNSNSEPDPADEELIADPGEVVPTPTEELDMASLMMQEASESGNSSDIDEDAQSIAQSVPDDVAQVVPDDIAFINDDDVEEAAEPEAEQTDSPDYDFGELPSASAEGEPAKSVAAPEPAQESAAPQPEPESPLPDKDLSVDIADSLLEPTAQAASSHAFSQLDNLIMSQKQGQTIEDLIREMLRPMLKSWLDENLPVWLNSLCSAKLSAFHAESAEREHKLTALRLT